MKGTDVLKILHGMTDVAGQGSYSVSGLKQLGYISKMAVWRKNPFGYPYDYCLNISKSKILYPFYAIKVIVFALYAFVKFDIFHFHFGYSLLPHGIDLPFIKLTHKPFFMEYHGDDIRWTYYRKYPKFYPYKKLPQKNRNCSKINYRICKYADGIIIHDDELRKHLPDNVSKVYVIPLRIDVNKFRPIFPNNKECPIIVHAPSDYIAKGSIYIVEAIKKLEKQYKFKFVLVEGLSQEEAFKIYQSADIIIDQLFVGTYGVFALEAMALGKPVICYISNDMIPHFPEELPIINADITNIENKIEYLLKNPNSWNEIGRAGREYTENYHDCRKIAMMQRDIYLGNCSPLNQRDAFSYVKSLLLEENIE